MAKFDRLYDVILEADGYTKEDAIEYARGMVWNECEWRPGEIGYHQHIDTVQGVGVWYDYGANYYFFTDEDIEHNEKHKTIV